MLEKAKRGRRVLISAYHHVVVVNAKVDAVWLGTLQDPTKKIKITKQPRFPNLKISFTSYLQVMYGSPVAGL